MPGEIPWQEVLLFVGAFVIWYAGVSVIYLVGGRRTNISPVFFYAWSLGFGGVCLAVYGYLLSSA